MVITAIHKNPPGFALRLPPISNILDPFSGGYAIAHPRLNATNDTPLRGVLNHIGLGIPDFAPRLTPHASRLTPMADCQYHGPSGERYGHALHQYGKEKRCCMTNTLRVVHE